MKSSNLILCLCMAMLFIIVTGCKKDEPPRIATIMNPPPPPPQAISNTVPTSYAGQDIVIELPTSSCTLIGQAHDIENNIRSILWSKISGPSSFIIEHPDSISTKVNNLQLGVYQFELTVTDSLGLNGKDRVNVFVKERDHIYHALDRLVYYPTSFTYLGGSYSGNIQSFLWSKIAGPSSFVIETPNSAGTKVSNLQEGVYQFEVFVQNTAGLTDRDTCTVIVDQLSVAPNEVVFTNQVWGSQGWGSGIVITNVYQSLPAGSVFRVYIKRDNSNNWDELIMDDYNSWYTSFLWDGDLHIFSYYENESDTPDIKLVY